jgi:small GTP-binding protein
MSKELKFDFNYEILPENFTQFDVSFKLIVVGDSGVGKSCLTNKATKNVFEENYNATIGFEFFNFNIKFGEKIIKLQIWDTCGQELYRSLITNFYRNSSLAIIVYTVTDRTTFENVDLWYKELRTHANPNVKVFLIGNKIDLIDQRRIQTEEGQRYADQYKLNKFIEASAKSGFNAKNIFIEAAKLLYDDYVLYHKDTDDTDLSSEASAKTPETISDKKPTVDINSKANSNSNKDTKGAGCCLGGK